MSPDKEKNPAVKPKKSAGEKAAPKKAVKAATADASTTPKKKAAKKATPPAAVTASDSAVAAGVPEVAGVTQKRQPSQGEIAYRAYFLYIERGGEHGSHENDWFRAEQELMEVF